jgi:hypothetical protein
MPPSLGSGAMAKKRPTSEPGITKPPKRLEDYSPGATEEEVLAALRKAIRTPKQPS